MFNLATWSEIELPFNITCNAETLAEGILAGQDIKGTFYQTIRTDFSEIPPQYAHAMFTNQPILDRLRILKVDGRFEAHLA
jgi:hypothetical protein